MTAQKPLLLTCLALLLALGTGCTLGPDPERPITAADEAERFANVGEASAVDPGSVTPWWREFGDPATVELVEMALENNNDLKVAAARVLESEALLASARSGLWPSVTYNAGANRTKTSFVLPSIGRQEIFSTTFSTSLDVGYQLDLFGKLKRTRQQAWASLLAEQAAHDTVLHAVVAGVVRSRVALANAQRSLAITQEIRSSWERTLATTERRYRSGSPVRWSSTWPERISAPCARPRPSCRDPSPPPATPWTFSWDDDRAPQRRWRTPWTTCHPWIRCPPAFPWRSWTAAPTSSRPRRAWPPPPTASV
jgi:hypothetical protein